MVVPKDLLVQEMEQLLRAVAVVVNINANYLLNPVLVSDTCVQFTFITLL